MIIDFHTHVFPEKIAASTIEKLENMANIKACTNGLITSLIKSMDNSSIDISVILPVVTNPKQFHKILENAVTLNECYPNRIISFGGIHPDSPNYKEELRKIKKMGIKGIKLHPDYQNTFFNDIKYKNIIAYATELDLIISVHAGYDIGFGDPIHCTPQMADEVIKDVQPEKLVLAHTGGFKEWDDVEKFLVGKNVYFDTSYSLGIIDNEQLTRIVNNHGADRILFATDSPWGDQSKYVDLLSHMAFSEDTKNKILFKNAKSLLDI